MKNRLSQIQQKLQPLNLINRLWQSAAITRFKTWLHKVLVTGPKVETEFLPGALEVSEAPPSPIGRAIILTIISFVVLGILWASLSKVDVVATAEGKLVPCGQVKLVQAPEAGVIREITVIDGQHVQKGELLVSLDPTASTADEASLEQRLMHLQCELSLWGALQNWSQKKDSVLPQLIFPETVSPTLQALYRERLMQESQILMHTIGNLLSNIERIESQEKRTEQNIIKLRHLLKIDAEISSTMESLYKKSASSRHQWLTAEQQRIRTEQDLAATLEQMDELQASIVSIKQDIARTYSAFRSDVLRKKADTESELSSVRQELAKATRRNALKELYAPVSGHVHQLAVHTLGGVVQGAETLMVIVPDGTELELELSIMNKDIGFIHEGQNVEVKLEAFPYTEYGSLNGKLEKISAGAVAMEDGSLLFTCTVRLLENTITIQGKPVQLKSGMRATGEVVLRKRRLISYFLSPLMKYTSESLRER